MLQRPEPTNWMLEEKMAGRCRKVTRVFTRFDASKRWNEGTRFASAKTHSIAPLAASDHARRSQ